MLTQSEITLLLDELKTGSNEAKLKLVEAHWPLMQFLSKRYIRKFPQFEDDIRTAAQNALLDRLTRIQTGSATMADNNIGALLHKRITYAIKNSITTARRRNEKLQLLRDEVANEEPVVYNQALFNLVVDEVMHHKGFTPREKDVFAMKLMGYNSTEIAQKFGVSVPRVVIVSNFIRSKMERYDII